MATALQPPSLSPSESRSLAKKATSPPRDCKGCGNGWKGPGKRTVLLAWRSSSFSPPSFLSMKCVPSILPLSVWSPPCCLATVSTSVSSSNLGSLHGGGSCNWIWKVRFWCRLAPGAGGPTAVCCKAGLMVPSRRHSPEDSENGCGGALGCEAAAVLAAGELPLGKTFRTLIVVVDVRSRAFRHASEVRRRQIP